MLLSCGGAQFPLDSRPIQPMPKAMQLQISIVNQPFADIILTRVCLHARLSSENCNFEVSSFPKLICASSLREKAANRVPLSAVVEP